MSCLDSRKLPVDNAVVRANARNILGQLIIETFSWSRSKHGVSYWGGIYADLMDDNANYNVPGQPRVGDPEMPIMGLDHEHRIAAIRGYANAYRGFLYGVGTGGEDPEVAKIGEIIHALRDEAPGVGGCTMLNALKPGSDLFEAVKTATENPETVAPETPKATEVPEELLLRVSLVLNRAEAAALALAVENGGPVIAKFVPALREAATGFDTARDGDVHEFNTTTGEGDRFNLNDEPDPEEDAEFIRLLEELVGGNGRAVRI